MRHFGSLVSSASVCLTLMACGSSIDFGSSAPTPTSSISTGNADPRVPIPPSSDSDAQTGDGLALPPVAVGGGYLTCGWTEEANQVQCFLADENDEPVTLPADTVIVMSFISIDGKAEKILPYTRHETLSGTMLYLSLQGLTSGRIAASIDDNPGAVYRPFDISNLPSRNSGASASAGGSESTSTVN